MQRKAWAQRSSKVAALKLRETRPQEWEQDLHWLPVKEQQSWFQRLEAQPERTRRPPELPAYCPQSWTSRTSRRAETMPRRLPTERQQQQ